MLVVFLPLLILGAVLVLSRPKIETGYVNGAPVSLVTTSVGNGARLEVKAAAAFFAMKGACLADIQVDLSPSGPRAGFRTSEEQQALRAELGAYGEGGLAAAVNRSPHQAGVACDFAGLTEGAADYSQDLRDWLVEHCHTFGWMNSGDFFVTKKEPWHYEFHPESYS